MWMLLVLVYGLLKGAREIVKKKSLERSSVIEVLFFYTLAGFLCLLPETGTALTVDTEMLPAILFKSFIIFLAWIFSFMAIKEMPVSFYGVLDLSRVLFATFLGILVLGERLTVFQMIGLPLVLAGLFMLRFTQGKKAEKEEIKKKYIVFSVLSCLMNAVSGLLDKIIMKEITSAQLQFWYMLFLVLFYGGFLLLRRQRINWKMLKNNYWILILSILFIIGDRALFTANSYPESRLTIMTLIKQSSCFVTILLGKLVYHEKNIRKKALCAAVILAGILIALL